MRPFFILFMHWADNRHVELVVKMHILTIGFLCNIPVGFLFV